MNGWELIFEVMDGYATEEQASSFPCSLSHALITEEVGFLGTFISQAVLQVIIQGCCAVWGLQFLLPKVIVWNSPEQDAEWSQRFCADFVTFLKVGIATHNRSKERMTSWGNWEGLCWVSREPLPLYVVLWLWPCKDKRQDWWLNQVQSLGRR